MDSEFENLPPDEIQSIRQNNTIVDFCNTSDVEIGKCSAIALTGAYGEIPWQLSRCCGQAIFTARPATDDSLPWAITIAAVEPGEFGRAIVSGVAPAYFSGTGKYVSPSPAGLSAGNSGNAAIMLAPLPLNDEEILPGLILLGGTAAQQETEEYHGIFKLQPLSTASVTVINGRNSTSEFCGATDVPGLGAIPVTELQLDDIGEWQIFLAFFYSGGKYSASFVTALPEDAVFSELIGIFKCGAVEQIYQSDKTVMVFKEEWYL